MKDYMNFFILYDHIFMTHISGIVQEIPFISFELANFFKNVEILCSIISFIYSLRMHVL